MRSDGYKWSFIIKIKRTMLILMGITMLLSLGVAGTMYLSTVGRLEKDKVREQAELIASDWAAQLDGLKNRMIDTVIDPAMQKYCSSPHPEAWQSIAAKELLRNVAYSDPDILFLHVFSRMHAGTAVYNNIRETRYDGEEILSLLEQATSRPQTRGAVDMIVSDDLVRGEHAILALYPVYSTRIIDLQYGMLLVGLRVSPDLYERIFSGADHYLTDLDGNLIIGKPSCPDCCSWARKVTERGVSDMSFTSNAAVVCAVKVPGWNYYVFASSKFVDMYRNGIISAGIFLCIALVILLTARIAVTVISNRILAPIHLLLDRMDHISEETLKEPIQTEKLDHDGNQLAGGFNRMIVQINELRKKEADQQKEADALRFHLLQSQIQPHFLYNILDSIHWQAVLNDDYEVSDMVKSLASFYRLSLSSGEDIVLLQDEIRQVNEYLRLQNIRYNNLVDLTVDIPDSCAHIRIPKLSLQPLIENAIYHGLRIRENHGGLIRISVRRNADTVCLEVSDNGCGMTPEAISQLNRALREGENTEGYGVRNVDRRIRLFFGESYGLHYEANETGGVTVKMTLPGQENGGGPDVQFADR